MKKIIISLLLLMLNTSMTYGAVSEDVYLRRDVFDARMEALMAEIRALRSDLQGEIRTLRSDIQGEIGKMDTRLNDMDKRISDLQTTVYWGFSILGLFIGLVTFAPVIGEAVKNMRKPAYATLEDVKRLIAESKLEAK